MLLWEIRFNAFNGSSESNLLSVTSLQRQRETKREIIISASSPLCLLFCVPLKTQNTDTMQEQREFVSSQTIHCCFTELSLIRAFKSVKETKEFVFLPPTRSCQHLLTAAAVKPDLHASKRTEILPFCTRFKWKTAECTGQLISTKLPWRGHLKTSLRFIKRRLMKFPNKYLYSIFPL